ncbi:hypothetical protein NHX12_014202 [Muraenolepis orangiensis]|uniref:Reverse transcriptase domain-containing protein n=1 Tax=Muraenolepis orangiensis TaxID=630683 RepID=A0A9Q0DDB5_9TELE|nr:hypothetical protein NHX12_014202 [Muraenolepis orangiensis]
MIPYNFNISTDTIRASRHTCTSSTQCVPGGGDSRPTADSPVCLGASRRWEGIPSAPGPVGPGPVVFPLQPDPVPGQNQVEEPGSFSGSSTYTQAASVNANLSGDFTPAELKDVMAKLKQGKAPGSDNIHPEFVTHQCEITSAWLCAFFSACLRRSKLPRTWRRAAVIALLKPNKPADDPKSYRPISLLCVPFKILERMIHSRIEPVVDSQLPKEQAGFRRGRSTVDQVTLLTQDLEDSFQAKAKAGVVLLDLTAAYDTVWHRGLHLKLLRTIPDRHMVNFIMEMLSNRSFILQTSDGQRSRLRRLRNGVPQGSVLSPMLFNIYIFDLPVTTSRRYGYADDLAIMLHQPTWKAVEEGLNQDMDVLAAYLRSWRLQLSTGKTVSAVFHLCNREARRELEISVENKPLEFQQAPKYLGVRLDRTLSYKQHLDEVRAKVTARVSLIRRLAGTTWGASAKLIHKGIGRPAELEHTENQLQSLPKAIIARFHCFQDKERVLLWARTHKENIQFDSNRILFLPDMSASPAINRQGSTISRLNSTKLGSLSPYATQLGCSASPLMVTHASWTTLLQQNPSRNR